MSESIFTLQNLYRAYKDCHRGKKKTANALLFELNREKNLIQLLSELQSGRYQISRHVCFIIAYPTPREIFAADFRDRIVHHLLCNEIFALFEQDFIYNSFANRKGKGTHRAVTKARQFIAEVGRERKGNYYLKLDIQSFFRSIDKHILFSLINEKISVGGGANYLVKFGDTKCYG